MKKYTIKDRVIDYIYLTHQCVWKPKKSKEHNHIFIKALADSKIISEGIYWELESLNDILCDRREKGEIIEYKGMVYHSG
jgi:hypothetical protein